MNAPNTHLFLAEFLDGTLIEQTPADVSKLGGANTLSDVWIYQETSPLVSFSLIGPENIYKVYFADGRFEVNGCQFWPYRIDQPEGQLSNLRLIYLRTVLQARQLGSPEKDRAAVSYLLGFQANDAAGKNQQFIMKIL